MQTAYFLARREALFFEPEDRDDAKILLELCHLFQPSYKWRLGKKSIAIIYKYQEWAYNKLEGG